MSKCDICQQETEKVAEQRIGSSYDPKTRKHTQVPYSMPLYCDDCESDMPALESDQADQAQIGREWRGYRDEGLGRRG